MSPDYELLVIGGGPCGLAAARGYREAGGAGPVAIVTDEQRMPYQRPPLTKELLRGEITEDELPLEDDTWLSDHGVALVSGRAVQLNGVERLVTLSGGRGLSYGSCLLATGAEPTRLPVPGSDDPSVRVIRTLDQVRELLVRLPAGTEVVVIGSGFIGCEIAASLRHRGHPVTLVSDEDAPNVTRLGERPAAELAGWLRDVGVTLALGVEVDAIERRGRQLRVGFGDGRAAAPVVVMATGVSPRSELLAGSSIVLSDDGAVPVDEQMRTGLPAMLAAGDVCVAHNVTAGRSLRVEHWGDALEQGEIAGRATAGQSVAWSAVPGFWSTIGERTLKYAAWGDGYDQSSFERRDGGAFVARYGREGRLVGVLTHRADQDYERGRELIATGSPWGR